MFTEGDQKSRKLFGYQLIDFKCINGVLFYSSNVLMYDSMNRMRHLISYKENVICNASVPLAYYDYFPFTNTYLNSRVHGVCVF